MSRDPIPTAPLGTERMPLPPEPDSAPTPILGRPAGRAGLLFVAAAAILAVARHEREHPGQGFGLAAMALLVAAAVLVAWVLRRGAA